MEITYNNQVFTEGKFRNEGVLLPFNITENGRTRIKEQLIPYAQLTLNLNKPVTIRIKKAHTGNQWYWDEVGNTFTAEGVNPGKTVAFNDYVLQDGRLLNSTDCEKI